MHLKQSGLALMAAAAFVYFGTIPAAQSQIYNNGLYQQLRDQPWSEWRATSCFKGLYFRTRRTAVNYGNFSANNLSDKPTDHYEFEFSNRYSKTMTLSWRFWGDQELNKFMQQYPSDYKTQSKYVIYTNSIESGEEYANTALIPAGEKLTLAVTKVKFGENRYDTPYVSQCD